MLVEEGAAMECTAVIRRDGEWWIGWIAEVPGVNGQERTIEELRVSLAEALSEALEFNRHSLSVIPAPSPSFLRRQESRRAEGR